MFATVCIVWSTMFLVVHIPIEHIFNNISKRGAAIMEENGVGGIMIIFDMRVHP